MGSHGGELFEGHAGQVFSHAHIPDVLDPHVYKLQDPADCEDLHFHNTPLQDTTRMALARVLERQGGVAAKHIWKDRGNTLDSLIVRVFGAGAAGEGSAKGNTKAKGKGKSKGG